MINIIIRYFLKKRKLLKEKKRVDYVLNYISEIDSGNLVIIDLGFNVGSFYKKIETNIKFKKYWGFEIQEDLFKKSKEFSNESLEVLHEAAMDYDGNTVYYEPKLNMEFKNDTARYIRKKLHLLFRRNFKGGSTLMKDKKNISHIGLPVRAIDFSNWLKKHVNKNDHIFLKVDIEGAEYQLLEHLISTGNLSLIHSIAVEWHSNKFGLENEAQYLSRKNIIKLKIWESGIRYFEWF